MMEYIDDRPAITRMIELYVLSCPAVTWHYIPALGGENRFAVLIFTYTVELFYKQSNDCKIKMKEPRFNGSVYN